MTCLPQLCLGTVQFGLPYGVTNQAGQVSEEEVGRILNLALSSGIDLFDTAQAYGTAETVLGRCWPTGAPRRLISKLPAGLDRKMWDQSLITSLQRLQAPKLNGLLLHRASDLLSPDGEALLKWLESLRMRGLVDRIGVSIYDASELEGLPLHRLQLVQLPLSVYDQRLIHDGTVSRLHNLGIAIHARSIFLQGLLLQSPFNWPEYLSTSFRKHHASWLAWLERHGLTPGAAAFDFVRGCEGIEAILFGVTSVTELRQLLLCWDGASKQLLNWKTNDWSWSASTEVDPRTWQHD